MFAQIKKFLIREAVMLLVTGGALLAVLAMVRFGIMPLARETIGAGRGLREYGTITEEREAAGALLAGIHRNRARLEAKLDAYATHAERPEDLPALLRFLQSRADRAGIEFVTMKPQPRKRYPGYTHYPFLLQISSTYHELARFINLLEELPGVVRVRRLALTAKGYRTLSVNVLVSCYLAEALNHE